MSKSKRNNMPPTKPTAAGSHSLLPASADISIAGKINDHILAATITPEAKPSKMRCAIGDEAIRRLGKNTIAAPKMVPINGRRRIGSMVGNSYFMSLVVETPCLIKYRPGVNALIVDEILSAAARATIVPARL